MSNPLCPHCLSPSNKIGVNKVGTQRYMCKSCAKRFVENPIIRTPSPDSLTNTERQRKWYYNAKELPEIDTAKLAGKLITFEGVEGSGKSTQLALLRDYLMTRGCEVVATKEPSAIAKSLLMEDGLDATGQLLIMMTDRRSHVINLINPALARGAVVLCDRYIDSTFAYQCCAGGAPIETLVSLREQLSIPLPDLTIWLDMPYQKGLERAKKRGKLDSIESKPSEYHANVQQGFEAISSQSRVLRIGVSKSAQVIHRRILLAIDNHSTSRV
jgi:dTMP kinase